MARILALDYGKVRTGIAVTDELQLIASGLTTVETPKLLDFLGDYLQTESVERFVVGLPKQMDNSESESEVLIQEFLKKLVTKFPSIPVERQDERFTSKMAVQSMLESGLKKKKRREKALVDEISATLILQAYLNRF
ncbi:Holliday junction resolvase RuvX [Allomuricauda sp. NBRC 101325]|uniref:Holliday junction resolvase RuvX n=1 Tax=Allomuricauda sp. NBRC 101325 TaxID=1113758 RepID=UPI0024A5102D|nr:Holliday junction resolvase RuvX [Muricauda sp. NBRC 101325]GLU44156.1 putative pre-16S rRNA nuclease [Muricauda sp. NBRC 101325]